MQDQIEEYIAYEIQFCTDDFVFFREQNKDISFQSPLVKTTISENGVVVEFTQPFKVEKSSSQSERSTFTASHPLPLLKIHEKASSVLQDVQTCEQAQRNFYLSAITSCGQTIGFSDIPDEDELKQAILLAETIPECADNLFASTSPNIISSMYQFSGDCNYDTHACTVTLLDMTANVCISTPLGDITRTETRRPWNHKRNIRLHSITSPDLEDFKFRFATQVNVDTRGICTFSNC